MSQVQEKSTARAHGGRARAAAPGAAPRGVKAKAVYTPRRLICGARAAERGPGGVRAFASGEGHF